MEVNEVIKFQPNVPVRLTLAFDGAKPCKNFRNEDQYLVTGVDGRAFITPYCHAKLEAIGAKRGDQIEITQVTVTKNQRRSVDWVVRKVVEGSPETAKAAAVAPAMHAAPASTQVSPVVSATTTPNVTRTALEDALRTAIAAAKAAEEYSASIGYPVKFDKDDVRNMATTVLIGNQKGAR